MYKIPANTLFIGQNQVFVPQCHSTNTLLAELVKNQDLMEGTVVITNNQTAGRGQRGNTWQAEPGKNLTFSLLLKPSFLLAKDQFYLTVVVSLAIRELLTSELQTPVKIKWPNDILVGDKKICGILIENTVGGDKLQQSIIGIGLNVNQDNFSIDKPTSMKLITDREFDLASVLNSLLVKLESNYLQLKEGNYHALRSEYLSHLYWINEERIFSSKGREFKGTITGVDEHGRLSISHSEKTVAFDLKDITFLQ